MHWDLTASRSTEKKGSKTRQAQAWELFCNSRTNMRRWWSFLSTKEHGQHLDVPLLSAWTKPIDGTIQSEMTKARQEIDE
jgi:hypothetical protein